MKYKCHDSCPPYRQGETPKCKFNNNSNCIGLVEIIVVIGFGIALLIWLL